MHNTGTKNAMQCITKASLKLPNTIVQNTKLTTKCFPWQDLLIQQTSSYPALQSIAWLFPDTGKCPDISHFLQRICSNLKIIY